LFCECAVFSNFFVGTSHFITVVVVTVVVVTVVVTVIIVSVIIVSVIIVITHSYKVCC
jgi:hypothetical protein